ASGNGAQIDQITVSWRAPTWALNVTSASTPATSATTRAGVGTAPVSCDTEYIDTNADGSNDAYRTRARDMFGAVRYLVFRSTNPKFVPTDADFVVAISGNVNSETGLVSYVDQSVHQFTNGIFNST